MELQTTQRHFQDLFDKLSSSQKEELFQWMHDKLTSSPSNCHLVGEEKISEIADQLREMLPFSGIIKNETIYFPRSGQHADYDPKHTVSVDAFLYDYAALDSLCDDGLLQRNYCKDCGSHNTSPLTFVSHSMSQSTMKHLFRNLLPDLTGKAILDIGSRLGAVLYGAHIYTSAKEIIGVEMNEEFCRIQEEICERHNLNDRIKVVHGDVRLHPALLRQADVLVIHSVVDFFLPEQDHAEFWKFVHTNFTESGKLLVTSPSLDIAIGYLDIDIDLKAWVKLQNSITEMEDDPDLVELYIYQCL